MKKTPFITFCAIGMTMFLSSWQNDNLSNFSKVKTEANKKLSRKKLLGIVPTLAQVQADLSSIGAVPISQPTGFTPDYFGYSAVYFYQVGSGPIYYVYSWSNSGDPGLNEANGDCNQKWNTGGERNPDGSYKTSGCYEEGHGCKVVNGPGGAYDWKIICCN